MKKLVFFAILLRIIVGIFYFHPDIKTYYFQTSFLKSGAFNIYKFLIQNREKLPLKEEFVYFPLTHIFLGSYQALLDPFVGKNLDMWLSDASSITIFKNPDIFLFLFLMKFPYLIIDILISFILLKFSKKAFYIWLFNPFTIFIFYVFSNVDIMPIFFTVFAYYLFKNNKIKTSALMLGIGAAFKVYPLLLLPFLFLKAKTIKEKTLTVVIPIITFGLIILPFWSKEFISSALITGLTTRIVNAQFLLFYTLLFLYFAFFKKSFSLLASWITVFLMTYSFAHFHIQWLAWIAPFIVLIISKTSKYNLYIGSLILFSFSIPFLYNDKSMSWGLLRIYSLYYEILPTPYVVVSKFINPIVVQNILQTVITCISFIFAIKLLPNEKYE